jgi:hypothetical protein
MAESFSITKSVLVLALGAIGNQPTAGLHGAFGLYADSGGAPSSRLAYTGAGSIVAGRNEIAVTTPVMLSPGTYWIGGEFDHDASICADNSSTNVLEYVPITFPTVPDSFGGATKENRVDINFYVVASP